jgi:hypothetical protein
MAAAKIRTAKLDFIAKKYGTGGTTCYWLLANVANSQ